MVPEVWHGDSVCRVTAREFDVTDLIMKICSLSLRSVLVSESHCQIAGTVQSSEASDGLRYRWQRTVRVPPLFGMWAHYRMWPGLPRNGESTA